MQKWKSLGLEEARFIVEAGIEAAKKTGDRGISVAVVDRQGVSVCQMKMDGASSVTVQMAFAKAYTAIGVLCDTIEFRERMSQRNIALCELRVPHFCAIAGGVLVKTKDGTIVGAVGTSGRAAVGPGSDEEIARAATAAFEKTKGFEG